MAAAVHQDIRQGSLTDFGLTPAGLFDRWPLWVVSSRPARDQDGVRPMAVNGQELPVPARQLQVGYQSSNGQAQPRSNAAWLLLFF